MAGNEAGTLSERALTTTQSPSSYGDASHPSNGGHNEPFNAQKTTADAFMQLVRASNNAGHRITTALIENTVRNEREIVGLARDWVARPFDLFSFFGSLAEAATRSQQHNFELASHLIEEGIAFQEEAAKDLQLAAIASNSAVQATTWGILRVPSRWLPGVSIIDRMEEEAALLRLEVAKLRAELDQSAAYAAELKSDGELREHMSEVTTAHAAGSELGLFILHKFGEQQSIPIPEVSSNLNGPDGCLAIARLLKAGLIDEDGVSYYLTPSGREILKAL